MHFFCAKLTGWLVIDKYNVFCGRHKPRLESKKKEFEAKALAERRNLSLEETVSSDKVQSSSQESLSGYEITKKPENTMKTTVITPPVKASSGKPSSFDRPGPPPLKFEPKVLTSTPKTGKPAQFEKMMSPPGQKSNTGLTEQPFRSGNNFENSFNKIYLKKSNRVL